MSIQVFTDGSSRGNPGPGGWGVIVSTEDYTTELGGKEAHTTNNRMELAGAIKAIEYIRNKGFSGKIEINSDSKYVITGITEWIKGWQAKGWKTANKKKVLNQELWEKLSGLVQGLEIEWKYVAGHMGHHGNERCDEIATKFADGDSPHLYSGPKEKYPIKLL